MKNLNQFMEELQLNEVHVRGAKPRNGSKVLANGKNIWVWNNAREFQRLAPFINRELGTDFEEEYDVDDWYEEGAQAVYGEVENNKLTLNGSSAYRPSNTSDTFRKTIKALNLNGSSRRSQSYDANSGDEVENDFETSRYEFNQKLSQKRFYHGTSSKYIEQTLKMGLRPSPDKTQFNDIEHQDKVFITTELEKAMFHATTAAENTGTFPLILELELPDAAKLVSDYDVVIDTMGADSEEAQALGYDDIFYHATRNGNHGNGQKYDDMQKRFGKRLGQLSTKLGIFGYKGRIPATFFTKVLADNDAMEDSMPDYYFNTNNEELDFDEFEKGEAAGLRSYDYWNENRPKDFVQDIKDIYSNVYDEFQEEDEEDDWDD
ncbi:poly(ADP-ribose) polymerase catalytic domain protein [Vibrio phage 1.081.O._10N.286.52.C2]|nr:poly(ADP-ribose) polymerase catalytic domain protein [Vibrio phage 1.081.O._10N.286.52.C2]